MTNQQYKLRRIINLIEALRDMAGAQAKWHSNFPTGDAQAYVDMYEGQEGAYGKVIALLEEWAHEMDQKEDR